LRILDSTIEGAGKGVFAIDPKQPHGAVIFKKNDHICKYDGQIISRAENDARYGDEHTALYSYNLSNGRAGGEKRVEDASCHRGIGSMINHSDRPNAIALQRGGRILIFAFRDIRNGQEIFTSYGNHYWRDDFSSHITKR